MVVFNGELIVAGNFTQVGGVGASRIAKWNGSNWLLFGNNSTVNNDIYALAVYNNQLYAAGSFTSIGGQTRSRVAVWDGAAWQSLGLGLNDVARSLAVYGNELIVGGVFTTAGGLSANRIAKWNGSSWSVLGLGVNNTVYALANINNELIVGGSFTTVGGVSVNRIAKWNGSWAGFGTGMNWNVYSLAAYSGTGGFLAGGNFTTAGGIGANRLAWWNGTMWSTLGTGMSGGDPIEVLSIAIYGTLPYAGGDFSMAGGIMVNNISRWGSTVGITQTENETPSEYRLYQNYPNPFNPATNIKFQIPVSSLVKLAVYDMTGKEVSLPVNEVMAAGQYEVSFNAGDLSSGAYYYTLTAGDYRETKRMILVK
jgi:hypothetical protein